MCLRIVPKHAWCDCEDPENVDYRNGPACTHHVSFDFGVTNDFRESYEFPKTRWEPCKSYRRLFTTYSGDLRTGFEHGCENTRHASVYKEFIRWDGLCSECVDGRNSPSVPAVKLRFAEYTDLGKFDEDTIANWPPRLPFLVNHNGTLLGIEIAREIAGRPENCRGSRTYVQYADKPVSGKWVTDQEKSAIFLLPDLLKQPSSLQPRRDTLAEVQSEVQAAGQIFMSAVRHLPGLGGLFGARRRR